MTLKANMLVARLARAREACAPPRRVIAVASSLVAMLGAVACSSGSAQNSGGRRESEDVPVAAAAAAHHDLTRGVTLTGPVEPVRIVGVNSRVAGTILSVRVVEGDRVRPGQLMAELDARETQAQFERARAVLRTAEAAFARSQQMLEGQIITNQEFEQARSAYETAESDVELWRTRLDFTRIDAPTHGVVTVKHVEAGTAVSPNQRLFDIADVSLLVVRVQMSELDVVHVAVGDRTTVQLDAYPDARVQGRVRRVFPSADAQTRLVPVEVALGPTPSGIMVRPGFLARIRFDVERRDSAVVVPASAVGSAAAGPFVYVIQGDTLARRAVGIGLTSAGLVEIVTGIEPGEHVVTSGQASLRTGMRVRITEGLAPPGADTGGTTRGDTNR